MLERVEYRRNGALVLPQRELSRPRPPLRNDIPRSKGVDLTTDLTANGYRYEDAVFKIKAELPSFRLGPHISDWLFFPGGVRRKMKGKGNPDEWEIDISDPNSWLVTGIGEYTWEAGDIEKRARDKRRVFKNLIEQLQHTRLLAPLLKKALPELPVPNSVRIRPFEELNLTFISPDGQTAEFFRRRNIRHIPIPRSIVQLAA